MTRTARFARVAAAFAVVGVAACAVNTRPPTTRAAIAQQGAPLAASYAATIDTVIERLARRAVARGDRTLDILLLSGGGQHGAYGTGFLRGWRTRADAPMPKFDLVTGVSTGSLQAPFALLGSEAALDTLSALYLRAADEIAPTLDWFFWLRRTGGVVNTDRYRATLARIVDRRMAEALGAELREDRQLLVATTDFDLGVGRVWDLSRELDTTSAALARTREILIASTAIPGIFPPTLIDGHLHSDGGVTANLLATLDFEGYRKLAARLHERGVTEPVTVRLWALVNVFTHMPPTVVSPSDRGEISDRGQLLMFAAQQQQVLRYLSTLARAVTADVSGLRLEMRYTAVPDTLSTDPAASKLFDTGWMRRLETLGRERARGPAPWDSTISMYARPGLGAAR